MGVNTGPISRCDIDHKSIACIRSVTHEELSIFRFESTKSALPCNNEISEFYYMRKNILK